MCLQNCLFLQWFVRSRRLDEQLTVTIIRLRPEQLGMALAGFSGRAQHCPACLFSVSVCIREMQGRKSVFVSIFILKPLRELSIASGVTSSFPRDSHSCASELRQLKTWSLLPFLLPSLANSEAIHRRVIPRNGHWFMLVMWQLPTIQVVLRNSTRIFIHCVSSDCVLSVRSCGLRKIIREVMNLGPLCPFLSWLPSRRASLVYSFCGTLIVRQIKRNLGVPFLLNQKF